MSWLELAVEIDPEAAESVSDLLAQYGYNGGVAMDQPIIHGPEGPEYAYDTQRSVTLRTYIPADDKAEETRARLEQALWHFGQMRPVGPLRVTPMEEEDWANAWKQHYTVQRIGERTVIVPSWLEYDTQPDDIVLRLDPGMAFGTGLHPTTQLCLRFLEQYSATGRTVLDLGCGSGILAIAAALEGAREVLALDTDPIAVQATRENAARNDVADRIHAAEGSLGQGATFGHWMGWPEAAKPAQQEIAAQTYENYFDVIAANIIAKVLIAVAADMATALKPGGTLISSGIIAEREDEVALAYAAAGLKRIGRQQEGDWVALVHTK
ncbi:MAG TPA: 50S ribosomal protein L11 methyltransferase [Roseiflexaceae bacterium]|nr:50S ribosomal protein L11 methyltransferase [Roseiflexaceae bacterium]